MAEGVADGVVEGVAEAVAEGAAESVDSLDARAAAVVAVVEALRKAEREVLREEAHEAVSPALRFLPRILTGVKASLFPVAREEAAEETEERGSGWRCWRERQEGEEVAELMAKLLQWPMRSLERT